MSSLAWIDFDEAERPCSLGGIIEAKLTEQDQVCRSPIHAKDYRPATLKAFNAIAAGNRF